MKALTICQPYAHLIATGEKRVENRSWETTYRGPLLIHAGMSRAWMRGCPPHIRPESLVFGAIVAEAELVDCVSMDFASRPHYRERYPWLMTHAHAFGPVLWILDDVKKLETPIPMRGKQGLWDVGLPYQGSAKTPTEPSLGGITQARTEPVGQAGWCAETEE